MFKQLHTGWLGPYVCSRTGQILLYHSGEPEPEVGPRADSAGPAAEQWPREVQLVGWGRYIDSYGA